MKTEYITIGSEIPTLDGYLTVDGYNGHIVYCTEWEVDRDGEVHEGWERRLTLHEIENEMKTVDGKNHKVLFKEENEDEE